MEVTVQKTHDGRHDNVQTISATRLPNFDLPRSAAIGELSSAPSQWARGNSHGDVTVETQSRNMRQRCARRMPGARLPLPRHERMARF